MSLEHQGVQNLESKIQVDSVLTQEEKSTLKEALQNDKDAVIRISKNRQGELRNFLMQEYASLTYNLVGKKGVKKFQKTLGITQDGIYGPDTFEQIVNYQIAHGLKVDGIIGPQTLGQVDTIQIPSKNKETERKTESIHYDFDIQKALISLEKSAPSTKQKVYLAKLLKIKTQSSAEEIVQALAVFQKVSGLRVTGIYDNKTAQVLKDSQNLDYNTPMSPEDIEKADINLKRTERARQETQDTRKIEIPKGWEVIFDEFFLKTKNENEKKEILSGKYPIALANSRTKSCIIIMGKNSFEFPVIFGSGRVKQKDGSIIQNDPIKNGWSSGDHSTVANEIYRFNSGFKASSEYGRAARGGTNKTILGARIESPESDANGDKWWHGVADHRIPGGATWGCIGMNVQNARKLADYVNKSGKGFGYVSRV